MNTEGTGRSNYVDIVPSTPAFSPNFSTPASFWPTPQADARLTHTDSQQHFSNQRRVPVESKGRATNPWISPVEEVTSHSSINTPGYNPQLHAELAKHTQHYYDSPTSGLPPVQPFQQLASTPKSRPPPQEASYQPPAGGLFTPPSPAPFHSHRPNPGQEHTMTDPRRMSIGQRPMMGPPETPGKAMQASPNLFPSLQFSPDFFSTQNMASMTAPVYPQQRLFWDPSAPMEQMPGQYPNTYQDSFNHSFALGSNVMPGLAPMVTQPYDLPHQTQNHVQPFLDSTAFPAPFQTSPRPLPPSNDNPTMFLSSPARRFGGADAPVQQQPRRPVRDIKAYHHQIAESRREMEDERDRRRSRAAKRADDELIMQSVKRALSPTKSIRPDLKRSNTHSGITPPSLRIRRQSRVSSNGSTSATSVNSSISNNRGRSSPLKQTSFASAARSKPLLRTRTSMTLAIDENGVAKTVLEKLPEFDDDMDLDDDDSQSNSSSVDETDFHMLSSQPPSFAFNDGDDSQQLRDNNIKHPAVHRLQDFAEMASANRIDLLSRRSFSSNSHDNIRHQEETIRQPKRNVLHVDIDRDHNAGDAQKALRAIIQDRSRSTSTQEDCPSSRQSDSSVQFHSSPPIQQNQFNPFNRSPTTITDPELATPNSDHESLASVGMIRCICNSVSPDVSATVQCESCAKWLHTKCIGIDHRRIPIVYVCVYCEQTPVRHATARGSHRATTRETVQNASPLAHKSTRQARTR